MEETLMAIILFSAGMTKKESKSMKSLPGDHTKCTMEVVPHPGFYFIFHGIGPVANICDRSADLTDHRREFSIQSKP
ncbi:MAG TPA: hypothetical protein VHX86_00195 [Tepidisphaeraceae bacterium]|nr:hypothetical protein [Tepidisphaeraceae bacterium]